MNLIAIRPSFVCAKWLAIAVCSWVCSPHAASGATIKVTTAGDDPTRGTTLREAITTANNNAFDDTIVFEIPAGQDRTIDLASELPHLTSNMSIINTREPVTIQPGTVFRRGSYYIFTITPGSTVHLEGLIITKGEGGVHNRGTLSMRNCTVSQNRDWGGVRNSGSSQGAARLTMRDCSLADNRFVGEVPSIFAYAEGGGALLNFSREGSASATLINCVLQRNSTAPGQIIGPPGGAIANVAFPGGTTSLSLTGCLLEGNSIGTGTGGGAIYNLTDGETATATVTLVDSTIRDNRTSSRGGGILNNPFNPAKGVVTVEKCTFTGNQAGSGGAVFNRGELTLTNCTLNENVTSGAETTAGGGGVYNALGTATVTNCTFNENRADNAGRAASIYNAAAGSVSTANSIYVRSGGVDAHFVNEGAFTSRGHNITNDLANGPLGTGPGGLLNGPNDRRATNAALQPLANNLGPTPTCALHPDSVAINAGNDAIAPPTDQRGFARSGVSDIGAYERTQFVPTSAKPGRLGNISTRLGVETGDNVLIGGFIVTGTEPKRVMLRAIGTSLPFENRLADPILELFDATGVLIESNDNWVDSDNKQGIVDSTIPPTSELESAIVLSLPANGSAYTAVVRGVDGGTGIGLVEVYDLDSAVDSKLANISTRGLVQTGDDVMIAGTIVTGNAAQKVIIRAIGPSLSVAGRLEDPALELVDANGAILAANDNWRTGGQESEIKATGVPPSNDLESAIVYQLPSNGASYTATVRGVGDTTGIAVVEVYALASFSLNP